MYVRGMLKETNNMELSNNAVINSLNENDSYKYLGLNKLLELEKDIRKKLFSDKFKKRIKIILLSKNTIKALNTWVIPTLSYTFGTFEVDKYRLGCYGFLFENPDSEFEKHHPKLSVVRIFRKN